ncbi:MAG: (d)CMP kinase [Candidatus Erginobacter occultus]|nr:(d)CMP kinase [Candidatus Erginobacter occultus]
MNNATNLVITMDGTCGSGKSTIAKRLAERLGFIYLDTGAMYRAVTWKALRSPVDLSDREGLIELAGKTEIRLRRGEEGTKVFADGQEVTEVIRTPEVTNAVKFLADLPEVRRHLVAEQRRIAASRSVVAEGRDTGTVVFPQADYKFFVDAPLEVRTERRFREFEKKGVKISQGEVRDDLEKRDHADRSRPVGALRLAPDGIVIDTGDTEDIETNLNKIISYIKTT